MVKTGKVELSVFKWKKTRLNRAIFRILEEHGPSTSWDLFKRIKELRGLRDTGYGVINRRVRALQEEGFLQVELKEAEKSPHEKLVYNLTFRVKLAMLLDRIDLDLFVRTAEESKIKAFLEVLSRKEG